MVLTTRSNDSEFVDTDGMTHSEFKQVMQQFDESSDARTRARLGRMMLFGIDGEDRSICEQHIG